MLQCDNNIDTAEGVAVVRKSKKKNTKEFRYLKKIVSARCWKKRSITAAVWLIYLLTRLLKKDRRPFCTKSPAVSNALPSLSPMRWDAEFEVYRIGGDLIGPDHRPDLHTSPCPKAFEMVTIFAPRVMAMSSTAHSPRIAGSLSLSHSREVKLQCLCSTLACPPCHMVMTDDRQIRGGARLDRDVLTCAGWLDNPIAGRRRAGINL